MPVYRRCAICGKKVLEYTLCECEKEVKKESYKRYKRYRTDKDMQKFYSSSPWLTLSELVKKHFMGMCVICWLRGDTVDCTTTHHIVETKEDRTLMLVEDNLIPLCDSCHKISHREYDKGIKEKEQMQRILRDAIDKFVSEYGL